MRVVAPGHFRRPCCYQLNTVYEPSPGAHARKSTLALAISVRGGGVHVKGLTRGSTEECRAKTEASVDLGIQKIAS